MSDILDRRDFLKAVSLGAAAMAMPGCASPPEGGSALKASENKPNIIYIMADDLGYADLGCYGQKLIRTPNLDRMAVESTRFTQCYAGSTVCAPSRSVLMTGQHTGHTRIRDNFPKVGGVLEAFGEGDRRLSLEAQDVTVAEVLKQAGYATGITGKWGLGEPNTAGVPNRQGLDEWLGYLNQNHASYYYTTYLWHNQEKVTLEGNQDGKRQQYTHDVFTKFALDFIRRHKNEPFFLYVAYTIPHKKFEVPSTEPYGDKPWPKNAKVYAAMITRMDRDVGRIIKLLKELGIDDNTIVFFCSDNGAAKKPKSWEELFDSCGPLRGHKGNMYEGGIRTPMVVRWPGKVPAGDVSDAVWYYADVLPTLAEVAGAKPPNNIDGVSVVPTLLGKRQNLKDRFLYWEIPSGGTLSQAVRWRNWKAVRRALGKPLELYNLSNDIGENHNVAAQHLQVIAKIEAYLKTAHTESPNWPIERDPNKK